MAPRRAHKKSRNGCDQCKQRRVKCDERGPPCTNCITRELTCKYSTAAASRTALNTPSPSITAAEPTFTNHAPIHFQQPLGLSPTNNRSIAAAPALESVPLSTSTRLRELELMHKFSTDTYKDLCGAPTTEHTWQNIIPRTALTHDFLMNGILALASLHIATGLEDRTEAQPYIDAALQYHTYAFTPFRAALENITPSNCEAVFAFSIITTVLGVALPRYTSDNRESGVMIEHILEIFELLQGVKRIFTISRLWLEAGSFSTETRFWETPVGTVDESTKVAIQRLLRLNEEKLAETRTDRHRLNEYLIFKLEQCLSAFAATVDISRPMAWLAFLDKGFISEFRHGEPVSVVMFMHWGVLLHKLEGHAWWAKGSGKSLVTELLKLLRSGEEVGEDVTLWPRQQIGLL